MRVGYVEVVVVLLYEIVSISVHLMLDAFFLRVVSLYIFLLHSIVFPQILF